MQRSYLYSESVINTNRYSIRKHFVKPFYGHGNCFFGWPIDVVIFLGDISVWNNIYLIVTIIEALVFCLVLLETIRNQTIFDFVKFLPVWNSYSQIQVSCLST